MELKHFYNLHEGETILLVGNGENLHLTPPARFDCPSIGMNTIHKYVGWQPDYYITVDHRVYREFGEEINEKYRDIPKFIPHPDLNVWQGENFYRFYHHAGELSLGDFLGGITYANVMHAAMQLAYFMGASTILMIGIHHKPDASRAHFWGNDERIPEEPPLDRWLDGYKLLADAMARRGVKVLNISEDTHVPENILTRGDWRDYVKG